MTVLHHGLYNFTVFFLLDIFVFTMVQNEFVSTHTLTEWVCSLPSIHISCRWHSWILVCLVQGWGTYLLSQAAWIVENRWQAAKINQFYVQIFTLSSKGK